MSEVLGKISFLDTPDVNGSPLLTQVGLTNLVIPGTGGFTPPIGTTAQRPVSPSLGEARFNTTLSRREFWNGSAWISSGEVLQYISGSVSTTSTTSAFSYSNTLPTTFSGTQVWSQSFTPIMATSTIIITINSFYTVNTNANSWCSGALFNGSTCFHAVLLGFTTDAGAGNIYTIVGQQNAGSTATRTYSFRAGPNVGGVATYFGQGTAGQAFSSSTDTGLFSIMEIAP